jgi:hypothetical protein
MLARKSQQSCFGQQAKVPVTQPSRSPCMELALDFVQWKD